MPKSNVFSGRISYIAFLFACLIIAWGIISFFTTHETLTLSSSQNNPFKSNYLDENVATRSLPVKTLLLSTQKGGDGKVIRYVNGDLNPTISIRPGQIQRWRVYNDSNNFFKVSIPGISFYIVARDGNVTTIPVTTSEEMLAPKDSIELLIQGPGWGNYAVVSSDLISNNPEEFMILKSESIPVFGLRIPDALMPNYDLRNAKIEKTQELMLEKRNGELYVDEEKVQDDVIIRTVGGKTVEQWHLQNASEEFISFTVPRNIFQVVQINGNPIERFGYDHTFVISPKGSVTIRVQ